MFNRATKTRLFTGTLLAGVAGVLVSGQAAFAAPYETAPYETAPYETQGIQIQPQSPPAYVVEHERTYTRTQRPAPVVESARVYDRDVETATTTQPQKPAAAVVNPRGISYMSGGIGADEQALFDSAKSQYPVKFVFANSNGAYVSDVNVTVTDKSGETLLGLQTEGPILLMDLEPGTYTIKANDNGQVKTQNITVSDANPHKSYTMHFKAAGPQDYSMTTAE